MAWIFSIGPMLDYEAIFTIGWVWGTVCIVTIHGTRGY